MENVLFFSTICAVELLLLWPGQELQALVIAWGLALCCEVNASTNVAVLILFLSE